METYEFKRICNEFDILYSYVKDISNKIDKIYDDINKKSKKEEDRELYEKLKKKYEGAQK